MADNQPSGLGERGARIWSEFSPSATDSLSSSMLDEIARTADRLDELDSIIQGKGVLNLMQFRVLDRQSDGDDVNLHIEVKFNAVLDDARKQAVSYAGLVKAFDALVDREAVAASPKKSPLDELMQKRKAKSA